MDFYRAFRSKGTEVLETTGGILYNCSGKPGSNYPDLDPGKEF